MRGWVLLAIIATVTGCGRVGFDDTTDAVVGDVGADGAPLPLPRSEVYIKASNTGMNDLFGASVSLSANGNVLAVGAYQEASSGASQGDNTFPGAGAVYIFTRATTWVQTAYLKASNPDINDQFGFTVALSADGHTLAVDAPLESSASNVINAGETDDSAAAAGAVYVFTDSGGAWTQQAYVKASNTGANDQFGYSLAISADGNTLAVGARQEDSAVAGIGADQSNNAAMDAGALYIFTRTGSTWSQQAYIKPSFVRAGYEFGRSVGISDDGNTVVSAATYDSSNATGVNGDDTNTAAGASGAVYVFTRSGTTWAQDSYLKASNTNSQDSFGWNVSVSGDASTIAVGALDEASAATGVGGNQLDNSATNSGAVYVFARVGAQWTQQAYVKAPNTETNDHFGWSTALTRDGNELVVSATAESSAATGIDGDMASNAATLSGAAYIYTRTAGQWTYASYLKATNTGASDDFGKTVDVAATNGTIVSGASSEASTATGVNGDGTNNGAAASGAAYVFE